MYQKVTMYLSKNGDSVELKKYSSLGFQAVDYAFDNIHPILQRAQHCHSYDSVLDLLRSIKNNPECLEFVGLYHMHNPSYKGHHLTLMFGVQKGVAHDDNIDKMIEFVETRIVDVSKPCCCSLM